MLKRYISETTAKAGIFLVFVVMLVVCILFAWSANVLSANAATPGIQEMQISTYDSALLLRQIDILQNQIDSLSGELSDARVENERLVDAQLERVEELEGSFSLDYAGTFYATSYCAEAYPHICGGNGVTASGTIPTPGITVAADWSVFPAGTWLYIDGVGVRRVEDRGSAIVGNRLDVVLQTHAEALSWSGQGNHDVWVLTWND